MAREKETLFLKCAKAIVNTKPLAKGYAMHSTTPKNSYFTLKYESMGRNNFFLKKFYINDLSLTSCIHLTIFDYVRKTAH